MRNRSQLHLIYKDVNGSKQALYGLYDGEVLNINEQEAFNTEKDLVQFAYNLAIENAASSFNIISSTDLTQVYSESQDLNSWWEKLPSKGKHILIDSDKVQKGLLGKLSSIFN